MRRAILREAMCQSRKDAFSIFKVILCLTNAGYLQVIFMNVCREREEEASSHFGMILLHGQLVKKKKLNDPALMTSQF